TNSRAPLGWGDDPPNPLHVDVQTPKGSRPSLRTETTGRSRPHPPHTLRLPIGTASRTERGWADDPPNPPNVNVPTPKDRRPTHRADTTRSSRPPPPHTWRLPTVTNSRAPLGWGDDPPNPPHVDVQTPKDSRPSLRTETTGRSRPHPPHTLRLPTSVFRLPASDFRLPCSGFRLPTSVFRLIAESLRRPGSPHRTAQGQERPRGR